MQSTSLLLLRLVANKLANIGSSILLNAHSDQAPTDLIGLGVILMEFMEPSSANPLLQLLAIGDKLKWSELIRDFLAQTHA